MTDEKKIRSSIYIAVLDDGTYDVQCVGITLLSQVDRMIRHCQRELLKRRAYGKPLSLVKAKPKINPENFKGLPKE